MSRTKTYWFEEINRTDEVDDSDYDYFQWVSDINWEESVTKPELLSYKELIKAN